MSTNLTGTSIRWLGGAEHILHGVRWRVQVQGVENRWSFRYIQAAQLHKGKVRTSPLRQVHYEELLPYQAA